METSREYRAKYNLEETVVEESGDPNQEAVAAQPAPRGGITGFVASLFLTDSEMGGRGGMD